jgi:hypothetical protein
LRADLRLLGSLSRRPEASVRTIPLCLLRRVNLLLLALLASTPALARPYVPPPDNLLDDRFTLQAGFIYSSNETNLRSDSTASTVGTNINAENLLGLPHKKLTGFGELMFRMKQRHRIRLSDYWLPLDRHGRVVLQNAINFKDTTYNAGDSVYSSLKIRSLALSYTYSFIKNERMELGASLGFDVIGFDASVSVPARLRTEFAQRSSAAPFAGLDGTVRISGRFYAEARYQYVKGTVSKVAASLKSYDASLLYRWTPNVTLGAGYIGYSADVNVGTVGDSGHYSLSSRGPQLFVRVGL